jgi:acetolactate synthase I/II/III large subunit
METYKGAEAFIDVLNAYGVEYIFFNPGIDTVPVQVTVSKMKAEGKKAPGLLLCLDESVAMAAAYGHFGISGKPQVVLVHRELGTLQVGGQMHNAYFGRVPVMLCAGSLAPTTRVNWMQQPYDSCCMTRNCVKWDHEMSAGENIGELAHKALSTAASEPSGPVYLATSWESYSRLDTKPSGSDKNKGVAEAKKDPGNAKAGKTKISTKMAERARGAIQKADDRFFEMVDERLWKNIDNGLLAKAADMLIKAKNPLIMAGHSGRHPESVAALIELAEAFGARVLNSTARVSFPTSHPLCVGIDPIGGGTRNAGHYLPEADVVLLIDYDIPYAPHMVTPAKEARIITIDIDPTKKKNPLWDRAAEVFIEANSSLAIPALTKAVKHKLTPTGQKQIQERTAQIEAEHRKIKEERLVLAQSKSSQTPISSDWLCYCISQVIDDDTIIVNQAITQSSSAFEQIYRSKPGTWLGCAGGSIGWALGAALGAKLADPGKMVVSLTGDGGFIWGCPEAALWSARAYNAPYLAIVFDNQAYGAIKGLVGMAYGEKNISDKLAFESGVGIAPPPDYALVAQACGAYGRTVKTPDEVLPALQEAVKQVRSGKTAVLDVKLA